MILNYTLQDRKQAGATERKGKQQARDVPTESIPYTYRRNDDYEFLRQSTQNPICRSTDCTSTDGYEKNDSDDSEPRFRVNTTTFYVDRQSNIIVSAFWILSATKV